MTFIVTITTAIRKPLVGAGKATFLADVLDSVRPASAAPDKLNLPAAGAAEPGGALKVCNLLPARTAKISHSGEEKQAV